MAAYSTIQQVKPKQKIVTSLFDTEEEETITLRDEQKKAVGDALRRFKKKSGDKFLWNAKMRFGKTLTALQLFKELSLADHKRYRRMLILTHRPVVNDGWFADFHKIFFEADTPFLYGSKIFGNSFRTLEDRMENDKACRYVFFASIQDLRGSSSVGGRFQKNYEFFSAHWDLLVVDEAHEGTQTELGDKVLKALVKKGTKTLSLSGTPFNLFGNFNQEDIYTWSYVDEQREKENWDKAHEGDHNPYGSLPRMNMFTYDLGPLFERFQDSEYSFNFHEFFRTDDNGAFVYEAYVDKFLDLMCSPSNDSNYPFSTQKYRDCFRHTFWLVPGVKEALALQRKLEQHAVFSHFDVVNVAGDGDPDDPKGEALRKVRDAISEKPQKDHTITLSCGKLTTGVTVGEWTAVFMLSGSARTGAANYMQTIFRVQSPGQIDGKQKTEAYVFDFAPDRVLTMMVQAVKAPTRPGKQTEEHRRRLRELLNFFPVIALQGSRTRRYDVDQLLIRLKHTFIERVVYSGFDNDFLYNDLLLELNDAEIERFNKLKGIIGSTPTQDGGKDIVINESGFDEEEPGKDQREKKPKTPLTEEEKAARKALKKKKEMRKNAISILRGISIRMPMLIYGCDLKEGEEITIDNFAEHIDPRSWEEFMPRGVTKQHFNLFKKYYDPEIFREAGRQICAKARMADGLPVKDRIRHIVQIFSSFRNPDKETVLTPWRVVNMHLSDTIGGFDFYDETHTVLLHEPRLVDRGSVTNRVFMGQNTRVLELNSKSGLYPLYMAYTIWRERCREWERQGLFEVDKMTIEEEQLVWDDVVANNIFVICKTPMAVSITKRTLTGFRDVRQVNVRYIADLVETLKNKPDDFTKNVVRGQLFWHNKNVEKIMKFNAIVGNPPYQEIKATDKASANSAFASALYPTFLDISIKLQPNYISLITPSRWMTKQGQGISDEWVDDKLKGNHFISIFDYMDASDCFPSVEIKGGVSYFLLSPSYIGVCDYCNISKGTRTNKKDFLDEIGAGIVIRDKKAGLIINKVAKVDGRYYVNNSFSGLVSPKHYFDRNEFLNSNWRGYSQIQDTEHPIKYYMNKTLEACGYGWIKLSDIPKGTETIPLNKIYIPMAGGTGNDSHVLGVPFLGEPNSVCSYTYLVIGYDSKLHNYSKEECANILTYIKSRFFRFMVSIKKKTQNTTRELFQFVPLQNFSEPWTDEKLYAKYGITAEEQSYIESLIKPME